MKKILLASVLFTAVSFMVAGCLKDKGFENNEYGINDPDKQPAGVGFPFGVKPKNDVGLDVSASAQTVNGLVFVNLESGNPAPQDVTVTLTDNTTALLAAYNSANGTNILAMPTNLYTIPATLVIPAGARNVQVPLVITNTTGLDANRQYAVGITISAVDGGYKIATNLDDLFIVFSVKNQYDGKYDMIGQFYHPSNEPGFLHHVFNVELQTSGPASVSVFWPLVGGYNTPLTVGGQPACCFAAQEFGIEFNPATNAAMAKNIAVGGTIVYDPILSYNGNTYNNRWDPVNKIVYLAFGYTLGPGGTVTIGASRAWIDTLVRTGPR
jgi:hypothetical protein